MESKVLEAKDFQVRRYRPSDRDSVRALCCETGFLGNAIDPVFEDRELFADFLTDYYLRHEPDSAFVVIKNDSVARDTSSDHASPFKASISQPLAEFQSTAAKVVWPLLRLPAGISPIHPLADFKSVA